MAALVSAFTGVVGLRRPVARHAAHSRQTLRQRHHRRGLGSYETLSYSINERYKSLTVTVGLDDNSPAAPARVSFKSGREDGTTLKSVTAQINRPVEVTVDVTGVAILSIVAESDDCVCTLGLGPPVLHRG